MSFTAQPTDANGTIMSSAVPDGTNTPFAVEAGPSKTTGGNTLAPVAVYQYDGYDATQGTQADSAATNSTSSWSVVALLKGILAKLLSTLTVSGTVTANAGTGSYNNASVGTDGSAVSTSSTLIGGSDGTNQQGLIVQSAANPNLRTILYNGATPLVGQKVMASSLPVTLASDQSNVPMNVAQYNGATVGPTNPQITSDQIRALIAAGQGFRATTTYLATGAANALIGLQLINNNTAKNIVIYNSIASSNGSAPDCRVYQATTATADAGLTGTPSVGNQQPTSTTTSVATIAGSPATTTETTGMQGTQYGSFAVSANSSTYVLQNGSQVYLPKNATSSASVYVLVPTSGNKASVTLEWVEF